MRKFFIVLAVLAIAVTSCKKDENEAMAEKTTKDPIAAKLLDFKQTIQSQNKEVVLYNLEEAEWNLEGLLNYEEANNEHNWYGLEFESRIYEVPVSNGQISSSDLNQAYENFLSEINIILAEDENFRSDLVDISIEENQLKDGTATVGMNYSFGSIIAIPNYNPFGPNDYWVWGDPDGYGSGGPCGSNTIISEDYASDRLQAKFNNPTTTGQPGYFTEVIKRTKEGSQFGIDTDNPAYPDREYMIYYDYSGSWDECLSPNELNYYLSKFDYIKNQVQPLNKTFASVDVIANYLLGARETILLHQYELSFGIFHPDSGGGSN